MNSVFFNALTWQIKVGGDVIGHLICKYRLKSLLFFSSKKIGHFYSDLHNSFLS